jgi:hypothetical protein
MLDTQKKLYGISEFKKLVPLSTPGIYKAVATGILPSVRVGRRIFIPSWYVERLLSEPVVK